LACLKNITGMKKIVASIQVRMNSERLPGKVLREINGKPLLGYLIERLKMSKHIDEIIVAVPDTLENKPIINFCINEKLNYFAGSENDVLNRMTGSLNFMNANIGVEVYGDCPLIDPKIVDYVIQQFINEESAFDFVGNDLSTSFPPGMEVEVFKIDALIKANNLASNQSIREHGTLFIRQNPEIFNIKNVTAPKKWFSPELEIEVDTEEDFYVIKKILENFNYKLEFSLEDIIQFLLKNPKLTEKNNKIERRWKVLRNE